MSAGISWDAPADDPEAKKDPKTAADTPSNKDAEHMSFSQRDVDSLILAGQAALVIGCMVRNHRVNLTTVRAVIADRGRAVAASDASRSRMLQPANSSGSNVCVATRIVCRVLDAFLAFQNVAGVLTPSMMAVIVSISEQLKNFVKAEKNSMAAANKGRKSFLHALTESPLSSSSLSSSPSLPLVGASAIAGATDVSAEAMFASSSSSSSSSSFSSSSSSSALHPWNKSRKARERKRRRLEKAIREYEAEEEEEEEEL